MLLKCYNLYFFQFFLHQPITNYTKGTLMGFEQIKFLLIASLAILKARAPRAPPSGMPRSLLPVANRVIVSLQNHIQYKYIAIAC